MFKVDLPTLAGFLSTAVFATATFPMLAKAFRTKDLGSYSPGNILLNNIGNAVYSFYVFRLPPGPVWFLHTYNLLTTAVMLYWYVKYEGMPRRSESTRGGLRGMLDAFCCPA